MAQRQASGQVQLLVGIVSIVHLIHKPCIAIRIGILHGNGLSTLQRQDEVFGVQHVKHRIYRVAIHLCHVACRLADSIEHTVHLIPDIRVNEFLITAKLGSVVATDTLQVRRCLVLIESRCSQIEHTEVERSILQDMVDGCRLGNRLFTHTRRYEHAVVQVALVHLPHVQQAEHHQRCRHILGTQLTGTEQQQTGRSHYDNPEGTPAIGGEYGDTHLRQVLQQRCQLVGRYLTHGLHLAYADIVGEEQLRHESEEQGSTTRQQESRDDPFQFLFQNVRFLDNLLQCHHSQQWDGKLCNHQDAGHCTELGVHRHVVEEEVGERHEVAAPRQEYRQDGDKEQCPLHRTFHNEQAQYEEHQHEGTDIHRSAGHRLVAPVLAQLLIDADIVVVGVRHSRLVVRQRHTGTTLGVGHQQRPCLVQAVAPLCDVVAVQSATGLVGGILLHQFTGSAHGLLTVLPGVIEIRDIDTDTDDGSHDAGRRGPQQMLPPALPQGFDGKGYHHRQDYKQIIVGHLHVVGMHLQGGKECRHHTAQQVFSPVGQHDARYHWRQIGQRHHLPYMPGGNDDEEITGESPHDGTQRSQIPAEVESPQQDVESQQIGKHIPHVLRQPQVVGIGHSTQCIGTVVRRSHLVGGHAAEQGVSPTCALTRPLLILVHFLTCPAHRRRVVAIQDAPLDVCRKEIGKRNHCK